MRDTYQTSSYFSLEFHWIGWLLCKTNHSPISLIFLILVIFVLDCWPIYTPCVLGCPFFISIKLITYQKKKKKSAISIYLHANYLTQGLPSLIYRTNDIVNTLLSKSNMLLGTIWLFFNISSETNQGHNHSTIVMVNLPAKLVYLILSVLCNTTKTKCHVKEEVLIKNIMLIFLLR